MCIRRDRADQILSSAGVIGQHAIARLHLADDPKRLPRRRSHLHLPRAGIGLFNRLRELVARLQCRHVAHFDPADCHERAGN